MKKIIKKESEDNEMRKRRLVNVLTSAALTAALVMSMGMTAMADETVETETEQSEESEETTGVMSGTEEDGVSSVGITKIVKTDGNTYQPNTTFSFVVEEGNATTYDNQSVSAGVSGGLSISGSADFTYTDASSLTVSTDGEYTDSTSSITVNSSAFADETPGIYHYTVKESQGTYSGVDYDNTQYDVYVYVLNDGGSNYVGYVVVDNNGSKSDLTFKNDYGADETLDATHDLTITKALSGNLQNASDTFKVTVKVAEDNAAGQAYKVVVTDSENNDSVSYVVNGTESSEITIKKDYTITIYGLTKDAVVTVTETDTNGYSASYTTTPTGMTGTNNVLTGSISSDNAAATLTNTKDATTPTGIILSFAPYILLVAFAGVFAVLFLGKKREEF